LRNAVPIAVAAVCGVLHDLAEGKLGMAIISMAWDALREQIETPPVIGCRDELLMRVKAYVEAKLADPELSLELVAHACSISVRALHRNFAENPAGSVSRYFWQRRHSGQITGSSIQPAMTPRCLPNLAR
jgi:hypothetical protein